jgi:hypothetical protein
MLMDEVRDDDSCSGRLSACIHGINHSHSMAGRWSGKLDQGARATAHSTTAFCRSSGLLPLPWVLEWPSALRALVALASRSVDLDGLPNGSRSLLDRNGIRAL